MDRLELHLNPCSKTQLASAPSGWFSPTLPLSACYGLDLEYSSHRLFLGDVLT